MRFERTKGSITNFSSGPISADGMLDMLVRLTQDVYEANGITAAADLTVADSKVLLTNLHNLNATLLTVYKNNEASISQFSGFIQKRIRTSAEELSSQKGLLSELDAQIRQEEASKTELDRIRVRLEASRGHLLQVKEACDALRQRTSLLSDRRLDDMAEEKKQLEAELQQREKKAADLNRQLDKAKLALDQARQENDRLHGEAAQAQKNLEALEENTRSVRAELDTAAQQMRQLQQDLLQARKDLEALPEKSAQYQQDYEEAKAAQTVILNAVNSARNDVLLSGNLFSGGSGSSGETQAALAIAGQDIGSWEALTQWFQDMDQHIGAMLEVYRAGMAAVANAAQALTSQKD